MVHTLLCENPCCAYKGQTLSEITSLYLYTLASRILVDIAPLQHGYKELTIPPKENGDFALKNHNALHIWPRLLDIKSFKKTTLIVISFQAEVS